jgi:hypothetical protein
LIEMVMRIPRRSRPAGYLARLLWVPRGHFVAGREVNTVDRWGGELIRGQQDQLA